MSDIDSLIRGAVEKYEANKAVQEPSEQKTQSPLVMAFLTAFSELAQRRGFKALRHHIMPEDNSGVTDIRITPGGWRRRLFLGKARRAALNNCISVQINPDSNLLVGILVRTIASDGQEGWEQVAGKENTFAVEDGKEQGKIDNQKMAYNALKVVAVHALDLGWAKPRLPKNKRDNWSSGGGGGSGSGTDNTALLAAIAAACC